MTFWTGEAGFGNRSGASEELVFDDKAEDRSEGAMVWLLRYVAGDWTPLTRAIPVSSTAKKPKNRGAKAVKEPKEAKPESWVCLVCDKSFTRCHSLSRHNKNDHIDKGTFDQQFSCPRCIHAGVPPFMISSVTEWCDHVEKTHGKMYAPVVTSKHLTETQVPRRKPTSTKRRREDEIPGMHILDLSEEEKKPRKRARKNNDEMGSMLLETLAGVNNSNYGESYDLFSMDYLSDTIAGAPLPDSPSSLGYDSDATLHDLELPANKGIDDRGLDLCGDDDEERWDFMMGVKTYEHASPEELDGIEDGE